VLFRSLESGGENPMSLNPPSEDIKDYLDGDSDLGLTFAVDLFISEMPASPDACVCVSDAPGMSPEVDFTYERPMVQVMVRGAKDGYRAAHMLAQTIRDKLNGLHDYEVNGARYIGVWAEGDLIPLGYDDNHRPQVAVNFRLHRTTGSS
jgi:hypothetical protein